MHRALARSTNSNGISPRPLYPGPITHGQGSSPPQETYPRLVLPGQWAPRVQRGEGVSLSNSQLRRIEALLPDWVDEIKFVRKRVVPRWRDRPPNGGETWREDANGLHAIIRLASRPPVGAVPQFQMQIQELVGEWPFRHVSGNFSSDGLHQRVGGVETPLRAEVLRTLPLGIECRGLEEFVLRADGALLHFALLRVHAPEPQRVERWRESFESAHGRMILLDYEERPSQWLRALGRAAGEKAYLPGRDIPRLTQKLLASSTMPPSVERRVAPRANVRQDLTHLEWTRVDSKECLIAEDVIHVHCLPNGHTELLVGVIDVVSAGRPPEVSSRQWGSFLMGAPRNAVVSRFEFDTEDTLCGFSTSLAVVQAKYKLTLQDLGELLHSDLPTDYVRGLKRLDAITERLSERRISGASMTEVSVGGSPGRLVFEPMVLFNRANERWLRSHGVPLLYRVCGPMQAAERQQLRTDLVERGFNAEALNGSDPLKLLLLLQQLDAEGERTYAHRIIEHYVRSARYSTEVFSHPGFSEPYTGFKPKGGSGINQLQLVRFLSGEAPLGDAALRGLLAEVQGHGAVATYSRGDREALAALQQLFLDNTQERTGVVLSVVEGAQPKGRMTCPVRIDGWDRVALLKVSRAAHQELLPGMQVNVRLVGFDTNRMAPVAVLAAKGSLRGERS